MRSDHSLCLLSLPLRISDSRQFVVFHFLRDCRFRIVWVCVVLLVLLLNWLQRIINSIKWIWINKCVLLSVSEDLVYLLEEGVSCVGCAVDDWVVVGLLDGDGLPLEELSQVLPVPHLLLQLKTVVVLIHLYLIWVVSK